MSKVSAATLDLTGVPCPQNTAKAMFELELMDEGERLLLHIDDGEPRVNVPASLEIEGHKVIESLRTPQGWSLLVERGEE